jgi:flagellar basal body-associated protein FliL
VSDEQSSRTWVKYAGIAAVISALVAVFLAIAGGVSVLWVSKTQYVVSKTQTEDNQADVSRRLTEIQIRLDDQNRTSADLANRMARIEESNKFIGQSIADLKIAVVPKH